MGNKDDKLTHDWMIENEFHHHKSMGISIYSKAESCYVHNDDEEPFCLRIQNQIRHKPVDSISDFIELHRIITI